MIAKEIKEQIIKGFAKSPRDVGSVEVQIALLSERIRQISEHLKKSPKDFHSQRGLLQLVGKRRRFAAYLEKNDKESFEKVQKALKEQKNIGIYKNA
ncbi:MAG: 30S ribosomal protein S15 [Candidatus Babeliales bacterium]|jgi:small subunit ribosomal protein S15